MVPRHLEVRVRAILGEKALVKKLFSM